MNRKAMKPRSVVVGLVAAVGLFLLGTVGASANLVWCLSDPPTQVVTPGGHNVTVNSTVYLPAGSASLKNDVAESAVASPDGRGGTLITVYVHVPAPAHVVTTVHDFHVSTSADGGPNLTLFLDIPIS